MIDSGDANLLQGVKNLLAGLTTNQGTPAQVDRIAFEFSLGAIVCRNSVLKPIQYTPAAGEVYPRPQIIVPPQINKFYIFDQLPRRSIAEFPVKTAFRCLSSAGASRQRRKA